MSWEAAEIRMRHDTARAKAEAHLGLCAQGDGLADLSLAGRMSAWVTADPGLDGPARTFLEAAGRLGWLEPATGGGRHRRGIGVSVANSGGARQIAGAEVLVDVDTGVVSVVRYLAVLVLDRAADRAVAMRAVDAGIAQGIAYALRDEIGRVVGDDFIPSILDVPDLEILFYAEDGPTEVPHAAATTACLHAPAAIAAALYQAVGLRFETLPLSADRVLWRLLDEDKI